MFTLLAVIAPRNAAMSRLKYSELVGDDHTPRGTCSILEKGRKYRNFCPPPALTHRIHTFITWYATQVPDDVDIFDTYICNSVDMCHPMGNRQLQRWVKAVAARAHVTEVNVHPQAFRHTLVSTLVDEGVSMADVSKFLGHTDMRTTMKNYWITDVVRLVEMMKNPFGVAGQDEALQSTFGPELTLATVKLKKVLELVRSYQDHLNALVACKGSAEDVRESIDAANPQLAELMEILAKDDSDSDGCDEGDASDESDDASDEE
jgi:hypothetical protein